MILKKDFFRKKLQHVRAIINIKEIKTLLYQEKFFQKKAIAYTCNYRRIIVYKIGIREKYNNYIIK